MPARIVVAALLLGVGLEARAQAPRAECLNGRAVLAGVAAFPCDRVDLVGHLPVAAFATPGSPAGRAHNDVWGWTDPQTGVEYALVGTTNGLGVVSLADPAAPRLVAKMPTATDAEPLWRDVKVVRDHAVVVADAAGPHGVQVLDLTRVRGLDGPAVTVEPDTVYGLVESAHNVVVDEASGFVYAVGFRYATGARDSLGLPAACDAAGFHAIDARDPSRPSFAGCFSDVDLASGPSPSGYAHDAQCVVYRGPDADYAGRQLCVGLNEDAVTVFDVTDKAAVRAVAQAAYPGYGYVHQGWLTDDHRYLLVDDEGDERRNGARQRTVVFDLEDLDDPELAFVYDSGLTTIDHNQYVRGRYAFQSNYAAGLRVLDLAGIADGGLEEVAFFDTYPDGDGLSFIGQWSNYPYFESGLVVANDDAYGLFVLRPRLGAEVVDVGPDGVELRGPWPSPARGAARMTLYLAEEQPVRVEVFDAAGRAVATLYEGTVRPGSPWTLFVPDGLAAGAYVVRVSGETVEASRRLVITD